MITDSISSEMKLSCALKTLKETSKLTNQKRRETLYLNLPLMTQGSKESHHLQFGRMRHLCSLAGITHLGIISCYQQWKEGIHLLIGFCLGKLY